MLTGLLIVAVVQLCFGSEYTSTREVRPASTAQYYCGQRLVEALNLFCGAAYSNGDFKRPNTEIYNMLDSEEPWSTEFDGEDFPIVFRKKQEAFSIITKRIFRDRRSGVVSECCHKPCTLRELSSYCGRHDDS